MKRTFHSALFIVFVCAFLFYKIAYCGPYEGNAKFNLSNNHYFTNLGVDTTYTINRGAYRQITSKYDHYLTIWQEGIFRPFSGIKSKVHDQIIKDSDRRFLKIINGKKTILKNYSNGQLIQNQKQLFLKNVYKTLERTIKKDIVNLPYYRKNVVLLNLDRIVQMTILSSTQTADADALKFVQKELNSKYKDDLFFRLVENGQRHEIALARSKFISKGIIIGELFHIKDGTDIKRPIGKIQIIREITFPFYLNVGDSLFERYTILKFMYSKT